MIVKPQSLEKVNTVLWALDSKLRQSRFSVAEIAVGGRRRPYIKIREVRLREAADYCGNHPGPCPVRFGGERPHRHYRFLQGTDWVSFNDMVNDVLDKLEVDGWAGTSVVTIRKGRRRRVYYGSDWLPGDQQEWQKDGEDDHYEDWCGKTAPASRCPPGTPGLRGWRKKRVRRKPGGQRDDLQAGPPGPSGPDARGARQEGGSVRDGAGVA